MKTLSSRDGYHCLHQQTMGLLLSTVRRILRSTANSRTGQGSEDMFLSSHGKFAIEAALGEVAQDSGMETKVVFRTRSNLLQESSRVEGKVSMIHLTTDCQLRMLPFPTGWNVVLASAIMGNKSSHMPELNDYLSVLRVHLGDPTVVKKRKRASPIGLKLKFVDFGTRRPMSLTVSVSFHVVSHGHIFADAAAFVSASHNYFI
jgi:hypothetical protein